jgi:regulatory protein
MAERYPPRRQKRTLSPLDTSRLEELALAYVARFATSGAKFEAYLRRKLRERGWEGDGEPDPRALTERYIELGYIDDAAFARTRAGGLRRRGYGQRRVDQALGAAGIGDEIRGTVRASEAEERRAALTLARKRGLGPFGHEPPDRSGREKQIAAMLRAGHSIAAARALIDADSVDTAEGWADEAAEDGEN